MERLTEKQYRALWIDLVEKANAQQQEIEQLKEVNRQLMWENISDNMSENITAEQAEQIKALTADKDEQAGRLMKMDYLLRRTLPILEVANDQQELIEAIDALLGGKEDV